MPLLYLHLASYPMCYSKFRRQITWTVMSGKFAPKGQRRRQRTIKKQFKIFLCHDSVYICIDMLDDIIQEK